ncbi:hypothetical protein F4824DRAFT_494071 [Ustulina deusta]|nr:hypothetical protein F4824DRAFT_494071 [Ustulina deusta]
MNGLQFQDFLFNDHPLDHEINIPDDIGECLNAVQQTGWILKELIACEHNDVQMILDETKKIIRLVNIKEIYVRGEEQKVDWNLDTATHATAFAHYLFLEATVHTICQQCPRKNIKGPCDTCVTGTRDDMKGACTNCYYSGYGHRCSIRLEREREEKRKECLARGPFLEFTDELLKGATDAELAEWRHWVREAKRAREEDALPRKDVNTEISRTVYDQSSEVGRLSHVLLGIIPSA